MNPAPSHEPLPMQLRLRLLLVAMTIGLLTLVIHGFTTDNRMLLLGLSLSFVGVLLLNRLGVWYAMIIGLHHSWIYIPGFPDSLSLSLVLAMALAPVLVLQRAMLREPPPRIARWLRCVVIGYAVVLAATAYVRGFGLRSFSADLWGGAAYVQLFAVILFFLLSDTIVLTRRQWRWTLIAFLAAGLVPSIAEMTFLLSKGVANALYHFVRPEGSAALTSLAAIQTGRGIVRFQVSKQVVNLFVLAVALGPYRGKHRWLIAATFIVACLFTGLSGHRSTVLYLLMFIPTVTLFTTRRVPVRLLGLYAVGCAMLMLFLATFGRSLPLSYQRAVSWVPFADIVPEARLSATGSVTWRLEVWKIAWQTQDGRWWIGRGFAFNPRDLFAAERMRHVNVESAVVSHNYHSGPLSLLLDLGIPGFILGSCLLVCGVARHLTLRREAWHDPSLARIHCVLLASLAVDVVRFYFVFGSAVESVMAFLIQLSMLEGLWRTDQVLSARAPALAGDVPSPEPPRRSPLALRAGTG